MSAIPLCFSPELYRYLVEHSVRQEKILAQLHAETLQMPIGKMVAAPEQAQFLALLLKLMGATRVIEIGTFTGYTTLAMAQALAETGKIITCDIHTYAPSMGEKYWRQAGVLEKINLMIMPGLTLLDQLILEGGAGSYDFAFIDADKKNNYAYFEKLITLVRPGGLIVIDNVLWSSAVIDETVKDANTLSIRHFNELIKNDTRVDISMIPLGDGLTLARVI